MARREEDREDLVRDAVAYPLRGELKRDQSPEIIFFGVHKKGGFSFYFDQDPVFHFDDQGRLRRAFIDGTLYRTQGSTLARLIRNRTETKTELQREDLQSEQLADFIKSLQEKFQLFSEILTSGETEILRATVEQRLFFSESLRCCQLVLQNSQTLSPRIPGKR